MALLQYLYGYDKAAEMAGKLHSRDKSILNNLSTSMRPYLKNYKNTDLSLAQIQNNILNSDKYKINSLYLANKDLILENRKYLGKDEFNNAFTSIDNMNNYIKKLTFVPGKLTFLNANKKYIKTSEGKNYILGTLSRSDLLSRIENRQAMEQGKTITIDNPTIEQKRRVWHSHHHFF